MKPRFFHIAIISFLLVFLIITDCEDSNHSNPVSYVDGYQPDYTEEKGTNYTGDFFPISPGKEWYYTGTAQGEIWTEMRGTYMDEKIDTTIVENVDSVDCIALSRILDPVAATLSGKLYSLLPEESYSELGLESTYNYPEIVRYYEKNDNGTIYIRAIPGDDGPVEVKDPVFIKSNLIVGDSWSSYPTVNTSSYINGDIEETELKAKCKIFVVGKDSINLFSYFDFESPDWVDIIVEAIQLDQVAQISATILSEGMEMKLDGKLISHLFFADSIGIVAMQEHVELSLKVTVSDEYGLIKINMSITIDDNLTLYSYMNQSVFKQTTMKQHSKSFQTKQDNFPIDTENISREIIRLAKLMML